jgi:probable HAF family extracellular repeat protein
MKCTIWTTTVALTLCSMSTLSSPAAAYHRGESGSQARYSAINLGSLGGTIGIAAGLNDEGWVSGTSNLAGDKQQHGFLWRSGKMKDLGTLGGVNSIANTINDHGFVAGAAELDSASPFGEVNCGAPLIRPAVVWNTGQPVVLPTLGGYNGIGTNLNGRDQYAGGTETAVQDPTCSAPQVLQFVAAVWDVSTRQVHQLPSLAGDSDGFAFDINDRGEAAGSSGTCAEIVSSFGGRPVLWRYGHAISLGSLGGTTNSTATDINERSQIVGVSNLTGDQTYHAFLWENGKMHDLGTLPGDNSSVAIEITNDGVVGGWSCESNGNCRGVLWKGGTITDINTLVSPRSSLHVVQVQDINARGEIAGQAYDTQTLSLVPVLLTPHRGTLHDGPVGRSVKVALPERIRKLLLQRGGVFSLRS